MKSKPCKQLLHSLRTSSRKSDLGWLILVLTFVCSLGRIFPQEIHLDARQLGESVNISARLESIPYKDVFTSLQDGLEAEITFQFRLYEKVGGVLSIFGDRLIGQREPSYRAHMNLYDNTYSLITSSGEKLEFKKREDFIESFFGIQMIAFSDFVPEMNKVYYLRARIRLSHVKLVPPLNLIYILGPIGITTDWKEIRIGIARGEVH